MNKEIALFIDTAKWIFAKTYATTWPHEYTLLRDTDLKKEFIDFAKLINTQGYSGTFYNRQMIYYRHIDMVYWTMDDNIEETDLINRVHISGTYESRLKNGTLPENRGNTYDTVR